MRPWWRSLVEAGRRRQRTGRRSSRRSVRHLIADELRWTLHQSLHPGKLLAAIVVAVGILAAFGPLTPGLVLSEGWRLTLALVLGMVAAVVAHGLLQRSPHQVDDDDPLPALRAVLAAVTVLLASSIALAYLLAAITGSADAAGGAGLDAGLGVDRPLLVGTGLLIGGVLAAALGSRLRVPGALLFLALGMAIGSDGLGWVDVSDAVLVQSLGVGALVVILFEGGLTTDMDQLRRGAAAGFLLATVGVAITAGVTALGAMWLLDVPSRVAWLIGAIVASTDAAAVFDLLRRAPLPERLAAVLKVESGANDPVAVLLTVGLLASWQAPPNATAWLVFGAVQLIGGTAAGVAIAWLGALLLRRIELGASGLYPILGLAMGGLAYGAAAAFGASGFLATYVAGIVLATEAPRRRRALRTFHTALANGAEVGLFLLLGLLVAPSQLPAVALTALAIAALLLAVGRPLAVAVGLAPLGFSAREITAVSWLGMRGAVPIVLATFAFSAGIEAANTVFNVVFFIVLVSALLQGTTAIPLIRRLGLATRQSPGDVIADALPIEGTGIDLVEVVVPDGSALVGQLLREVPAPDAVLVVAVARDEQVFLPRGDTRICPQDLLFVTTTDSQHGIQRIEQWACRPATPEPAGPTAPAAASDGRDPAAR